MCITGSSQAPGAKAHWFGVGVVSTRGDILQGCGSEERVSAKPHIPAKPSDVSLALMEILLVS